MTNPRNGPGTRYVQALLASTALVSAGSTLAQTDTAPDSQSAVMEEIIVRGVARKYRPEDQTSATGLNMSLIDTRIASLKMTPSGSCCLI